MFRYLIVTQSAEPILISTYRDLYTTWNVSYVQYRASETADWYLVNVETKFKQWRVFKQNSNNGFSIKTIDNSFPLAVYVIT